MFNITTWIKLCKAFGIYTSETKALLMQSLFIFESVESKISHIKMKLANVSNLSLQEIEAFRRYLKALDFLLYENWENFVHTALESVIHKLEMTFSDDKRFSHHRKKYFLCCKKINKECKEGTLIKPQYVNARIQTHLEKISMLEGRLLSKIENFI